MQSHSTEARGLASASLSQRAPALRHSGQSLWLMYCRMIGLPGTVCICLAAVLHQFECKLRNEPTHWGATSLLIGIGLVIFSALWVGTSRGARLLVSLGGRCRHCHVAISARYPLIESLIAAVFVLFYYRELLSGGQNLPVRPANSYNGIVWILLYTKWDLVSIYFFHMMLLVLLLGWGMINFDRFRVPWYAATGMVALSIVLAATFPTLNPLAAKWSVNWFGLHSSLSLSLIGCAFGALFGLSYEWAAGLLRRTSQSSSSEMPSNESRLPPVDQEECMSQPIDQENEALVVPDLYGTSAIVPVNTCNAMASAALLGSQLGVEAVAVVFALSVILCIAANLTFNRTKSSGSDNARPVPLTLVIFVVALVYLAFWHQTHGLLQNMLAGLGLGQLGAMS